MGKNSERKAKGKRVDDRADQAKTGAEDTADGTQEGPEGFQGKAEEAVDSAAEKAKNVFKR